MTFPHSDRVIFDKNPLEAVICQLRFPTILEIRTELPVKFQNMIRDGYPLYESDQLKLPAEISQVFERLPIPKPVPTVTHKFIAPDGSKVISLNSDFIAFTDTKYVRWERYSEAITRVQAALEEIYKPAFYTRIGLRYTDVIDKVKIGIEGETWEALLKPSLIGLLGAKHNIGNSVNNIGTQATMRLDEVPGGMATIRHGLKKIGPNREVYSIDIDFYTTERRSSEDVPGILRRFNILGGNFFRWAITERLRTALGPRELGSGD